VPLPPRTLAAYAAEIARAFGLEALAIPELRNERQAAALVAGLRAHLHAVRPVTRAASIGEVLDALAFCARAGGPARRTRKQLAELDDLVGAASFARTKRAERARVFALLLVVFDLTALTGVAIDARDPEAGLKLVRRAQR
jgi:hypothetical protein